MATHSEKVQRVAEALKAAAKLGRPVEFVKRGVSHVVPNPYEDPNATPKIDLSDLNELLEIDTQKMTCTAEGGLPFFDLTRETLKVGLMPVVVPELKTITIGGAVSGCSIESQSFRYGGFHDNCLEYEIVTGTGEVMTCSREKDPEVFELMHGSYGTLSILTKITFKLMPAKPFVHLEYQRFTTYADFWKALNAHVEKADYPLIDAIIHSRQHFTLCLGTLVDQAPYVSNYEWLNVYYKSTRERSEDYLTTQHYFFRYDAECHWLSRTAGPLENKLVRLALGKFVLGSSNLIAWSNRLRHVMRHVKRRPDVVVDVFVPGHRFDEFYAWYERDFDFFPLWIVPYRMPAIYPWVSDEHQARMNHDTFMIDAAVYGRPNSDPRFDWSERIEKKVMELGGVKTLISRNHYTEDEFWQIYSKPRISAMKKRLDPQGVFPELYARFAPEKYRG